MKSEQRVPERPLMSIGMPVYNGEAHLAEALASALAQDYAPLEVIVSDNASTDATAQIIHRFASVDDRVRYIRNPTNVGMVENFRRVLAAAHGTYFTWLAHDDLLSARNYVSTVVGFLECHPDVVGCMTGFEVYNHGLAQAPRESVCPELHPDRPWPEARRQFFRWPPLRSCGLQTYGVFRREALARTRISPSRFKNCLNACYWEIPVLCTLCGYGRLVALPECLRVYRVSTTQAGYRLVQEGAPFDFFLLGLGIKLRLLGCAWRLPIPFRERIDLLRMTMRNLFTANLRQPMNLRWTMRKRELGLTMLRAAARERAELIEFLNAEIAKRRDIIRSLGHDADTPDLDISSGTWQSGMPVSSYGAVTTPVRRRRRGRLESLLDLFRPLSAQDIAAFFQQNEESEALRELCGKQLDAIQRLHTTAESLLEIINTPCR